MSRFTTILLTTLFALSMCLERQHMLGGYRFIPREERNKHFGLLECEDYVLSQLKDQHLASFETIEMHYKIVNGKLYKIVASSPALRRTIAIELLFTRSADGSMGFQVVDGDEYEYSAPVSKVPHHREVFAEGDEDPYMGRYGFKKGIEYMISTYGFDNNNDANPFKQLDLIGIKDVNNGRRLNIYYRLTHSNGHEEMIFEELDTTGPRAQRIHMEVGGDLEKYRSRLEEDQ